jgi:SAM-dependent methyltransferase
MAPPDVSPARALSFGAIAEDYDRFRPGPPVEAVRWIVPPHRHLAVDIGAGTGALTRLLVDAVERVVAAEPDLRMAALLARNVPGADVVSARAEELPLDTGIADAVVGASMWHWVDPERAAVEVARVLRPGGVLGLLWSGPDRTQPWVADVLTAARPQGNADAARGRRHRHDGGLPADAPFSEPETHTVEWSLPVTRSSLVELACTYSEFIILSENEKTARRQAVTDAVLAHQAGGADDEFVLPMRCQCWRAQRRT